MKKVMLLLILLFIVIVVMFLRLRIEDVRLTRDLRKMGVDVCEQGKYTGIYSHVNGETSADQYHVSN